MGRQKIVSGSIVHTTSKTEAPDLLEDIIDPTEIHAISIVDTVENNILYCNESIVSKNGSEYIRTKDIAPDYQGEYIEDVELVTPKEFDILVDSNLINRKNLKNT